MWRQVLLQMLQALRKEKSSRRNCSWVTRPSRARVQWLLRQTSLYESSRLKHVVIHEMVELKVRLQHAGISITCRPGCTWHGWRLSHQWFRKATKANKPPPLKTTYAQIMLELISAAEPWVNKVYFKIWVLCDTWYRWCDHLPCCKAVLSGRCTVRWLFGHGASRVLRKAGFAVRRCDSSNISTLYFVHISYYVHFGWLL